MRKKNIFIFIISFFLIVFCLKSIDLALQKKYGLGSPILYKPSIKHGYLLKPNQNSNKSWKVIPT